MKSTLFAILFWNALIPSTGFGQPFTLVKDIYAGPTGGLLGPFAKLNNNLFFVAEDEIHSRQLWKSDGTSNGTVMVMGTNPTPGSLNPGFLLNFEFNGLLFFTATDGSHGFELWKTDGTETGTQMLKDINPSGDSNPSNFVPYNNILVFTADNGSSRKLWKTDGTENGTVIVSNSVQVPPGNELTLGNGTIFFNGSDGNNTGLWKSDGTETGTVLVKNFGAEIRELNVLNQTLLFVTDDGIHGYEWWKSDGTEAGTVMIKDINPGQESSSGPPYILSIRLVFNGSFYFDAYHPDLGSEALWKTDGTEAGTVLVKDIFPGPGGSQSYLIRKDQTANNGFYFKHYLNNSLWFSDGTEAGTREVKIITLGQPDYGYAGTPFFISHNDLLFFLQHTPETGVELWRTDGTENGTFMVKDLLPGTIGQDFWFFSPMWDLNNVTFMNVDDGTHGVELWRTNGTGSGTVFIQDIEPGPGSSRIREVMEINGTVFASIETPTFGTELWVSSLAALPTSLIEFKGRLNGDDALLEWKTQNEIKNSLYVLERSFDRNNFTPITNVASKNLPGTIQYEYIDPNVTQLEKSILYYRIKQINPDGKSDYSSIVAIRMTNNGIAIRIQPNPVRTELKVELNSRNIQHTKLSVVNMNGIILMQKDLTIRKGSQFVSFDVSRLPAGTYILSIKTDQLISKEMFIKK